MSSPLKDSRNAVILMERVHTRFPVEAGCGSVRGHNPGTAPSLGNNRPLQPSIKKTWSVVRVVGPTCCTGFTLPLRLTGYWVNPFLG